MSREFDYLAALVRDCCRDGAPARRRAPDGLDWNRFLDLCTAHRIGPSVLPLVQRNELADEISVRLDGEQNQAVRNTILKLMFLEQIIPTLESDGCRPIVLKGGVLATSYYPAPEQRYLADLDLLVERPLVGRTCAILQEMGLESMRTQAHPVYYRDYHFHWPLVNPQGFVVEIHWALTLRRSVYSFDLEGLRSRARKAQLGSIETRIPSAADLLMHIVCQCTAGGYGEMRRVVDAARILPEIRDPDALVRQAKKQRQTAALWLLLTEVQHWTGVSVPTQLLERLRPGRGTARILRNLVRCVYFGRDDLRHRDEALYLVHWLCVPGTSLRLHETFRYLNPDEEFWLESGFGPEALPGPWHRFRERLSRGKSAAYLAGLVVAAWMGRTAPETTLNSQLD